MILQALYEYYQRKAADPESGIAPEGFQWVEISFVIVIDQNGRFVTIEDQRQGEGRERKGKSFLLPKATQRSGSRSYAAVNFLWDHIGYVFGHPKSESEKDLELAKKQNESWLLSLRKWAIDFSGHPEIKALTRFYEDGQVTQAGQHSLWHECVKKNGTNILFRLDGQDNPIPCLKFVQESIHDEHLGNTVEGEDETEEDGDVDTPHIMRCLITGELGEVARKHTKTPINKDNKSFVGIQKNSGYDSYGKTQAYNSPVSRKAEFAYTTALKSLLEKGSRNRVNIGDSTTVFWAQKRAQLEDDFPFFWSVKDNPDRCVQAVDSLLRSPQTGSGASDDTTPFYVLGLSPGGGSRISVRSWHAGTVGNFSRNIRQHFLDLEIVKPKNENGNLPLFFLLKDIAVLGEADNIPPNLSGNVMQSVLTGVPYPVTLMQQAVRRIRAQQSKEKQGVKYTQAAILRAVLNRNRRFQKHIINEEINVALDTTNTNSGYRLGRLFAALEKIQEDAQGSGTIRERFYGAASSSPISVFPQLLKLKNHHLAKIENPAFRVVHEKRLTEIFGGLQPEMPAHLPMEDQARFAVGYYHQRQAFFTKSDKSE